MEIAIRKIVRPLYLREFAEEYGDDFISVWVNPPRAFLTEYEQIRQESKEVTDRLLELAKKDGAGEAEREELGKQIQQVNDRFYDWFARIWSQGEDASKHVTMEQVREIAIQCERQDPALWTFLTLMTWGLINDHRNLAKKGPATSS